ncbi:DUF317 domain-containing protein [Streptomyces sp. SPB162]|uniref:DUF317 domain-containing protein n=1 Tax=Streptomyces sp. SPB162 TaxID=2940560 RepID=UPI0024064173|nr:DUF317 domain-containing protein [Streptomyces sp. SPB162]
MPLSERQLAAFADEHAAQIPYDTSPRHLAGPGDARHVTHGLAAAGWNAVSDPLSAEIIMASPDLRHRLQLAPQSHTSAWWRLRAEPVGTDPGWYAEFGGLVPAEVLAAVTDALVAPPPQRPDPWQHVTSAGWHHKPDGARSPDSMCHIELQPSSEFHDRLSWHIDTHEPGHGEFPGPRIWHAYLDENTPAHLVSAFLTALTDRSPLQRGMFERTGHCSAVQEPSALRPQQVVDAHATRIKHLRARTHSAGSQQTKPATAPAHASTAQPAARR